LKYDCRNIEEILAEKGEQVRTMGTDDGNIEVILKPASDSNNESP